MKKKFKTNYKLKKSIPVDRNAVPNERYKTQTVQFLRMIMDNNNNFKKNKYILKPCHCIVCLPFQLQQLHHIFPGLLIG